MVNCKNSRIWPFIFNLFFTYTFWHLWLLHRVAHMVRVSKHAYTRHVCINVSDPRNAISTRNKTHTGYQWFNFFSFFVTCPFFPTELGQTWASGFELVIRFLLETKLYSPQMKQNALVLFLQDVLVEINYQLILYWRI